MSRDSDLPSSPGNQPAPPPDYTRPVNQQDWILQQLNLINREVGMSTAAMQSQAEQIKGMGTKTDENTKSLDKINIKLAYAAGALTILIGIGGYLIDKKLDQVLALIPK